MLRQTTVKNLPRTTSVAKGGGEMKESQLKKNAGAMTRDTNVKSPPQAAIVAGGRDETAKMNTKWEGGTTHGPASCLLYTSPSPRD